MNGTTLRYFSFLESLSSVLQALLLERFLHMKYGWRLFLTGITNDVHDPSVDTFRSTTIPILKQFGVPVDQLELKIVTRGAPPLGGGEVRLKVPIVNGSLSVSSLYVNLDCFRRRSSQGFVLLSLAKDRTQT
jgi:RNA 3'-terminal phosphate cyclase